MNPGGSISTVKYFSKDVGVTLYFSLQSPERQYMVDTWDPELFEGQEDPDPPKDDYLDQFLAISEQTADQEDQAVEESEGQAFVDELLLDMSSDDEGEDREFDDEEEDVLWSTPVPMLYHIILCTTFQRALKCCVEQRRCILQAVCHLSKSIYTPEGPSSHWQNREAKASA